MKTLCSVLILTFSFLSAGAFAGNSLPTPIHKSSKIENVTVVYKNQAAPTKSEITDRICKLNFCREA